MIIGIISDTHGLLRPEVIEYLSDSDLILHAGDIGSAHVITELQEIAPVTAIRGNIDYGSWTDSFPETQTIEIEGRHFHLIHNLNELDINPVKAGYDVVISGHSHKPKIEETNGVLYLNPGSAGPRRFTLPITLAKLFIDGNDLTNELYEIEI